ncbi:DUF6542 domain-containing protein [Amycolatopsis aidingensis]|uniref:DUF6542 domain-containing protein n=1 Tax=Amycolatopsis aidingensis TaxID=2842453 RepID=UPI002FC5B685
MTAAPISDSSAVHPRTPLQIPTLAALALLALFAGIGLWPDAERPGWVFGVWLTGGALAAAALVRPVGLWTIIPAPAPVTLLLVLLTTLWRGTRESWTGKGFLAEAGTSFALTFPSLAIACTAGIGVAGVRTLRRSRGGAQNR